MVMENLGADFCLALAQTRLIIPYRRELMPNSAKHRYYLKLPTTMFVDADNSRQAARLLQARCRRIRIAPEDLDAKTAAHSCTTSSKSFFVLAAYYAAANMADSA